MKKLWTQPMLEILDIRMTMNGPGASNPDCFDASEGKDENHDGLSNASCLHPAS